MTLPIIYNPSPISITAATYPDSYLVSLFVMPPNAQGKQMLQVKFRPYNQATGEMYPGTDKDFGMTIQDVMAESQRSTLFGQVMGGIITIASLELQEQDLLKKIAALPAGDTTLAALQAQLAAVRQAMGVSA